MTELEEDTPESYIKKLFTDGTLDLIRFDFSCGGDSMGDTEISSYLKGEPLSIELDYSIITDWVYRNIEFYEASDGHYLGEFGHVDITYENDEVLPFKYSTEEFEEDEVIQFEFECPEELQYLKQYIDNFDEDYGDQSFNYKGSFILTEKIISDTEQLKEIILDKSNSLEAKGTEIDDSYRSYRIVSWDDYITIEISCRIQVLVDNS